MNSWLTTLRHQLDVEPAVVRVMVATVRGSAPREPGACMLVSKAVEYGTIGGGHLELKAIEIARQMLQTTEALPPRIDRFVLGATLGQCCGGVMELIFERFTAADKTFLSEAIHACASGKPTAIATLINSLEGAERRLFVHPFEETAQRFSLDSLLLPNAPRARLVRTTETEQTFLTERIDEPKIPLWLFGAGHVGKALVKTLADLPFAITWIDSREAMFPKSHAPGVRHLLSDFPADETKAAPPGTYFLVLTHSHDLDYEICRGILERNDFAWVGLIGSRSKATRFKQRLARQGIAAERIARLTCPVGAKGITSKLPAAIAISVAAQLLQITESQQAGNAATNDVQEK